MTTDEDPTPIEQGMAADAPADLAMRQWRVNLSSGRPFLLAYPTDVTDAELMEFVGWLGTVALQNEQQQRVKGALSRIVLPEGFVPRA